MYIDVHISVPPLEAMARRFGYPLYMILSTTSSITVKQRIVFRLTNSCPVFHKDENGVYYGTTTSRVQLHIEGITGNVTWVGKTPASGNNYVDVTPADLVDDTLTITVICGNFTDSATIQAVCDGYDGESFTVVIESDNGSSIRYSENFTVNLSARVYFNVDEVTDELEAYRFVWKRISQDTVGDVIWNRLSKTQGHKTIEIKNSDVYGRSVFVCEVDFTDYTYTGDN